MKLHSRYKCKCSVCNKFTAKHICKIDGEYYDRPICRKCFRKLVLQDEDFAKSVEKYNNKAKNKINNIILMSVFMILFGLLVYSKVFSDYRDVWDLFQNKSQIIYFILFAGINYVSGYVINISTQNLPIWARIILNFLFSILLTLVGCVTVIRDDLEWDASKNPFIYLIPIMAILISLLVILNCIKTIDKALLIRFSIIILLLSMAISLTGTILSLL